TPVGERVWVYLRPGLSLTQLQARLDQIAVACHAATVTIDRASERNAAFLRLDVKRRDALTDTIASPVVDLVDPATPRIAYHLGDPPTALDLPDVPNAPAEPATTLSGRTTTAGRTGTVTALHKPAATTTAGTSAGTASRPAIAGAGGADLSDWID